MGFVALKWIKDGYNWEYNYFPSKDVSGLLLPSLLLRKLGRCSPRQRGFF